MQDSFAQTIAGARDDLKHAHDLASAGQVLEAISAYNSSLKQYDNILTYGNFIPPPKGLTDNEYGGIRSETLQALSELQDLLTQQLTPDRDLTQAMAVIEGFMGKGIGPSWLHWLAGENGGGRCFEIITRYLESRGAWDRLLELFGSQLEFLYALHEREYYQHLMGELERIADKLEAFDPNRARTVRFWIRQRHAIEEKSAGHYEEALHLFEVLREEAKRDHFPPQVISQLWRMIAECQLELRDYQQASASLEAGQSVIEQISDPDSRLLAQANFNMFTIEIKDQIVAHTKSDYIDKADEIEKSASLTEQVQVLEEINRIASASPVVARELAFHFTTARAARVAVGDYLTITSGQRQLLGQVQAIEEGPNQLTCRGMLLTTLSHDVGTATIADPFDNGIPTVALRAVVEQYLSSVSHDHAALAVGDFSQGYTNRPIPVVLDHTGFEQHTALIGQSGSGKSFALGRLIEELLQKTGLRIIVLDPNSDFRNIWCVEEKQKVVNGWRKVAARIYDLSDAGRERELKQRVEDDYDTHVKWLESEENYRRLAVFSTVAFTREHYSDGVRALRLRLSDVDISDQARLLHLDPQFQTDVLAAYVALLKRLPSEYDVAEVLGLAENEKRSRIYQQVLSRLNYANLRSFEVFAAEDTGVSVVDKIKHGDWQLLELDIGELTPVEKRLVSAAVLKALWKERDQCVKRPTLVVIDEAHHLVPNDPNLSAAESTANIINEIAGEGRKYGILLMLVSQSPSKLHAFALSQCSNLILMKMKYESDLAVLRDAYSQVSRGLLNRAVTFDLGEALVIGEKLVKAPTRFRFAMRRTKEGRPKVDIPLRW